MRILDSIRNMLPEKSSVQMVADDPQMASELLLIIRMMFADGELKGEELDFFKKLCQGSFGIPEEDVPEVIHFLQDTGYETSGAQAASTFVDMPQERKKELLGHLLSMARADENLHRSEVELIARVAQVLGLSPQQVREMS